MGKDRTEAAAGRHTRAQRNLSTRMQDKHQANGAVDAKECDPAEDARESRYAEPTLLPAATVARR